jgi:hypothetical protein
MWRRLLRIGTSSTSRNLLHKMPMFAKRALFLRPNGRSVLSVEEVHLKWRGVEEVTSARSSH